MPHRFASVVMLILSVACVVYLLLSLFLIAQTRLGR